MASTTRASTASSRASTPSADPVVELRDARKSYGRTEALKGVSLLVPAGELLAVLGPNGAGKTTAITLMTGLRHPTGGSARLFGLPPGDLRARSRTGVMLQESGTPGTLTVKETVQLFSSYYPSPLKLADVLAAARLVELAGRLVKDLSGGERQRLYFALAICGDPEALFLDEPSVGMDPATRRSFWEQVRALVARRRAIVLTTHYLEEADAIADRVAVIDHGELIAEGTPERIKERVAGRRISFRAEAEPAPAAFADLPVQQASFADGRVELLTNDAEAVLRALYARGMATPDLEVAGARLEDAVLALVGGR
jgi:ABC-2 type transport system ATP-binding protein